MRYGTPVTVPKAGPIIRDAFANCLAAEKAVGGGNKTTDDPADPPAPNASATWQTFVIDSGPTTTAGKWIPANGGTPTGWHVEVRNNSGAGNNRNVILNPYVLCRVMTEPAC